MNKPGGKQATKEPEKMKLKSAAKYPTLRFEILAEDPDERRKALCDMWIKIIETTHGNHDIKELKVIYKLLTNDGIEENVMVFR